MLKVKKRCYEMLRVILVIAMIAVSLLLMGCSDDVATSDAIDTGTSQDVVTTPDAVATDLGGTDVSETGVDATVEEDAQPSSDADPALGQDAPDPEGLPSDPTEDPEGESAFYSFPAWEVPPSDNDNE